MRRSGPEWVSENIFVRRTFLDDVGDVIDGHTHHFAHTTYLPRGAVHIVGKRDGVVVKEGDFYAAKEGSPPMALILPDVEHTITALEPNTIIDCIYSHRDAQGRVVQEFNGFTEHYH